MVGERGGGSIDSVPVSGQFVETNSRVTDVQIKFVQTLSRDLPNLIVRCWKKMLLFMLIHQFTSAIQLPESSGFVKIFLFEEFFLKIGWII